jgi:hypothetical protein
VSQKEKRRKRGDAEFAEKRKLASFLADAREKEVVAWAVARDFG